MLACLIAILLSVKLESIKQSPLLQTYKIGTEHGIFNNIHFNAITPGFSSDDISRRNVADRFNHELDRQTIARESANLRYEKTNTKTEIIGVSNLSCVPYVQSQGMITSGYGWAKNYPVQKEPTRFASTFEGKNGHLVFVEQDLGDTLIVRDSNYRSGFLTRRTISKSLVKGYLN